MTFIVEVQDPYSEHPELTDERFECENIAVVAKHVEDATGLGRGVVAADLHAALVIDGEDFDWTDPETGVEVTAKRVEHVGAGARG